MKILSHFTKSITKNYVNFKGRVGLKEFWAVILSHLILLAIAFLPLLVLKIMYRETPISQFPMYLGFILPAIYYVLAFLPGLGIKLRRAHDLGFSTQAFLFSAVPFLLVVILGLFLFWFDRKKLEGMLPYVIALMAFVHPLVIGVLLITKKGEKKANKYGPPPPDKG